MIQIDMPMPDNCLECRFNTSEFGYCNATPVEFVEQVSDCEEDGKPEWCPLKAQEPRVMTLEELVVDDVVWLEDCDKETTVPGIYCNRNDIDTVFATRMKGYLFVRNDEYGKRWRCWTSRPTKEQMEAIPWN